jgi:prevent-host-death family protein
MARNSAKMKAISALTARTQLGQIMEIAMKERARFVVEKNGRPAIVIMAIEDYLASGLGTPAALARLQEESRKRKLDLLSFDDINAEISSFRAEKRSKRG